MSRLPRRIVTTTLSALTCLFLPAFPAAAQEDLVGLCPLFLQQEQTELEDLELAAQVDETRLEVAEEIFVLLDGLWQNDLIGRLPYLSVKHRRDAAAIDLQLARARIERQDAAVVQYRLACSAPSEQGQTADDRRAIEEAYERYVEADCQVRALDVAVFEVDLEYQEENLRSAVDLRQGDIASRQDVLFAEADTQITLKELELARLRAARCRQ